MSVHDRESSSPSRKPSNSGVIRAATSGRTLWGEEAIISPEPWMKDAACAQANPDAWFPEKGGTTKPAKSICRRCDVVEQCLAYALRTEQTVGIWGGKSSRELARLRRNGGEARATTHVNRDQVRRLHSLRASDAAIARSLGCSSRTVTRIRNELGLPAWSMDEQLMTGAAS